MNHRPEPFIDLDHNATTAPRDEVIEAMLTALRELPGNPSSTHRHGLAARAAIEVARGEVATLIGAAAADIVFTGGGTESDNLAVLGGARARVRAGAARRVIASAVEHPAIERCLVQLQSEGFVVVRVPVTSDGGILASAIAAALTDDTAIVTVMHANNETGAVMPLAEVATACRRLGVPVHTDAAQSVGKIPVAVDALGVALLTIAGHKLYGPKGVGALYVRDGTLIEPVSYGAGHERGLRPGTENVPGIVGLGRAAAIARAELAAESARLTALRDRLEHGLRERLPDLVRHGPHQERLPNTLYASIPGVDGRTLVAALADAVALSAGAACHALGDHRSAVLVAMGVADQLARSAVRFSLGRDNTAAQIDQAVARVADRVQALRARR